MVEAKTLAEDLRLAVSRVAFAHALGLHPDSWQEELLDSTSDRVLLNASRQSGKSTCCALIALHRAIYHPGSLILCLSPTLRQSGELFAKITGFYQDLPNSASVPTKVQRSDTLELENGSRVVSLPGDRPGVIRGYSAPALVLVDEAAQCKDELIKALHPMLAVSKGRLFLISTPFGMSGVFFEAYQERHRWHYIEAPASECPRISPEYLEEQRVLLGEWFYEQEFLCQFKQDVHAGFSVSAVARMVTPGRQSAFAGTAWG